MQILKVTERFFSTNKQIGILLLRIFIGCQLLYGVVDNVLSWEKMIEFSKFLELYDFPFPIISAIASVYIQLFCAILILIGFRIRIASFFIAINFIVALLFVHFRANDSIEGMTPALAMLFGSLTLLFTGADKISLTYFLKLKSQKEQ